MTKVNIINWTESDGRNPVVLFDNFLTTSTPSITAASATLTESTYEAWNFTIGQTLTFDLGTSREYNAFCIVGGRNTGGIILSTSTNNTTFTPINPAQIPTENSDCTLFLFNKKNTRYFRVQFIGSGAGSIRSLWLSKAFEFPGGVGMGYTPIWMAQEKELLVSKTMNGQFVGNRVVSKGASTDIPMLSEERSFVEEDLQPFMNHYNDGQPFIWASGPSVFRRDVAYVWRQQNAEMKPSFDQSGNWMSFTMKIEGYVT